MKKKPYYLQNLPLQMTFHFYMTETRFYISCSFFLANFDVPSSSTVPLSSIVAFFLLFFVLNGKYAAASDM